MKRKTKYSAVELDRMDVDTLGFEGEWKEFVGDPESRGSWIVWGGSFSGKTMLCLRIARYMAEKGMSVGYVSLEEGASQSMKEAFRRVGMNNVSRRVSLYCNIDAEELERELERQRSPKVIIIDSLQYLGINYAGYKSLRSRYPNKLFIWISHAKDREPQGATAMKIRYDASVKIMVEGFVAHASSRYGGGKDMEIRQRIKNEAYGKDKDSEKQEMAQGE